MGGEPGGYAITSVIKELILRFIDGVISGFGRVCRRVGVRVCGTGYGSGFLSL